MTLARIPIVALMTFGLLGCDSAAEEPVPEAEGRLQAGEKKPAVGGSKKKLALKDPVRKRREAMAKLQNRKVVARPVAEVKVSPDDPVKGKFNLEDATQGLTGKGDALIATLETSKGDLTCELYDDKAPITVANFVGLARGLRPWKNPEGKWVKKAAYDGTTFHRIIKGFMIQGGDPTGTGGGQPGYVIPDEIWEDAHHDKPGLLCMANRGKNTNGAQFFILDGKAPHLDNGYTIFGMCEPTETVREIASGKTRGDRAVEPVEIKKVTIARGDKKAPAPATGDGGN